MHLKELFESNVIKLRGFGGGGPTPVSRFLDAFFAVTDDHPFNDRVRVIGSAMVELVPSVTDRSSIVHLSDIQSGQSGEGTKAMQLICDLADEYHVAIDLYAKGYGKTPTRVLIAWYERFGFVENKEHLSDDEGMEMIRTPR